MAAVASRNPFDILSETPAAPAATPIPAEKQKTEAPTGRASQRGRSGPKGGRYYQRGGGTPSTPREPPETEDAAPREGKRSGEERGRGRGRGGFRGRGERGRGGRGRVFDRHSATGKTDSEKKISQGWGADEGGKELKAEEEGSKDAAAEAPAEDSWGVDTTGSGVPDDPWGVPPAPEAGGEGEAAKEAAPAESRRREEEEDNTLTYDQWLAQQKDKTTVPKLEEVRKPNDGDDGLFKGAVPIVKDNEEEYFAGKARAARQRAKKKDEKQVQVLTIDAPFADRQIRGRGGRGGDRGRGGERGRDRGRGGRGRGRGDANGVAVNVNNQADFPALAAA